MEEGYELDTRVCAGNVRRSDTELDTRLCFLNNNLSDAFVHLVSEADLAGARSHR